MVKVWPSTEGVEMNLKTTNSCRKELVKKLQLIHTLSPIPHQCFPRLNTQVILDFVEEAGFWTHTPHVWFICHWLAMSHACYNPLILFWMNTKFREGYLLALYRLLPCCRSRVSQSLLQLRQTAGLQRGYTSSTRASRTQRLAVVVVVVCIIISSISSMYY